MGEPESPFKMECILKLSSNSLLSNVFYGDAFSLHLIMEEMYWSVTKRDENRVGATCSLRLEQQQQHKPKKASYHHPGETNVRFC